MVSFPEPPCVVINYCVSPSPAYPAIANTRISSATTTHAQVDQITTTTTTTTTDQTSTDSAAPTTQPTISETANRNVKAKPEMRRLELRNSGYEPPSLVRMALQAIAEDPHRTLFNANANLEGVGEKVLTAVFLTVEMECKLTVPIVRTFVRIAQLENHTMLLEYLKRFDVFAAIPLTPAKHLKL